MAAPENDVEALAAELCDESDLMVDHPCDEHRTIAAGVLASAWLAADRERYAQQRAAEAWDEGRVAERRDWEFTADIATPDEDRQPWPNPYRAEDGSS